MKKRNPPSAAAREHKRAHDRERYAKDKEGIKAAKRIQRAAARALPPLDQAKLTTLFRYDPLTGIFTRIVGRGGAKAGDVAGTVMDDGYIQICIDSRCYAAHRLAWLYMTGKWPTEQIDHWDTDHGNNRFANLRDVSDGVNKQNIRKAPAGKKYSELLGAQWCKQRQKWKSSIRVEGRIKHIGFFETDAAASEAYVAAKRLFHEGCTL